MAKKATKKKETLVVDLISFLTDLCEISSNKFYSILTADEQKIVFAHITELSKEGKSLSEYEEDFKNSRDFVIHFLDDKNYNPKLPNAKKGEGMKHIPYEIKALMWYMAYRAIEIYDSLEDKSAADAKIRAFVKEVLDKNRRAMKGISNQLMIDIYRKDTERKRGYSFSKKTFQDFAMSPSRFYKAVHYNDISMINKYAGEKKGVLGSTLRYIVSFARDYENFLDLFGGSGRATMAVQKIDGVDYYINDWSFCNVNYYNVMKDDKLYRDLRTLFETVQLQLSSASDKASLSLNYYKKYKNLYDSYNDKYNSSKHATIDVSERLLKNMKNGKPISLEDRDLWNNLFPSANSLNYKQLSDKEKVEWAFAFIYIRSFTGTADKSMESESVKKSKITRFINYDLHNFDLAHKEFTYIRDVYNTDAIYWNEFLIDKFMNKPSRMYESYVQEIQDVQDDKSIALTDKTLKALLNRLGYTSKKAPRNYRTLIYCDSPYLNTAGYGKKNKKKSKRDNDKDLSADGDIGVKGIQKLIVKLIDFYNADNDFIFSCRAGMPKTRGLITRTDNKIYKNEDDFEDAQDSTLKSAGIERITDIVDLKKRSSEDGSLLIDSIDMSLTNKEAVFRLVKEIVSVYEENYVIYDNIFINFEALAKEINKPIYVVVPLKTGDTIEDCLHDLRVAEVFITTIKVPSISESLLDRRDFRIESYTIEEFNEILRSDMLMSKFAFKWDYESGGSASKGGAVIVQK